eukprot:scaffold56902_cov19-Tisochrysis_lutea.AAC.2
MRRNRQGKQEGAPPEAIPGLNQSALLLNSTPRTNAGYSTIKQLTSLGYNHRSNTEYLQQPRGARKRA